ncbi:hypothetical protein FA13DRAFT_1779765 [Coprinellus micaceus]|uniref:F-box domain-containing protein n=1 Tax=Coprinellus micaceus TaxID=71717 RepID=A0A4Y7SFD5_COPMI|nr:hypothetical protein FA13DRAFT_1779765 [Coprinellus micaceus]
MNIELPEAQSLDQGASLGEVQWEFVTGPLHARAAKDVIQADQENPERRGVEHPHSEGQARPIAAHDCFESPIGILPVDILEHIFTTCLSQSDRHSSPHPAVTATHVCHEWRAVALALPLLWTRIDVSFDMDELWRSCLKLHNIDTTKSWGPNEAFYLSYIALCNRHIESTATRASVFIERSLKCALDLSIVVSDLYSLHYPGLCRNNRADCIFSPIHEILRRPSLQWRAIDAHIRVASPSAPFLSATFLSDSPSVTTDGKFTIEETTNLDFLKLRMDYFDIVRTSVPYSRVTVIDFGSPRRQVDFLPHEAIGFLKRSPNLLRCTIHLSTSPGELVPPLPFVHLSKLKSMVLFGDLPPVAFAAALDLPSLTHICTANTFVWPIQQGDTSVVGEWCRRYGGQLTEVGIGTGSLSHEALVHALEQLRNVESLNLARSPMLWHPSYKELSGPIMKLTVEALEVVVNLIEMRRTASCIAVGSIRRLEKVIVSGHCCLADKCLGWLALCGVDICGIQFEEISGINIPTPNVNQRRCSLEDPCIKIDISVQLSRRVICDIVEGAKDWYRLGIELSLTSTRYEDLRRQINRERPRGRARNRVINTSSIKAINRKPSEPASMERREKGSCEGALPLSLGVESCLDSGAHVPVFELDVRFPPYSYSYFRHKVPLRETTVSAPIEFDLRNTISDFWVENPRLT